MKNVFSLILLLIMGLNCHAQISFESGYFIDNTNQKIDCLIKNVDWKNNPTQFQFKPNESQGEETKTIKSAKEFGVYNKSKYVRRLVDIDRSSQSLSKLTKDKNPIFKEEELFLKVLIEGKASLFLYEDGSLRRFFYTIDGTKPEQLVYKTYRVSDLEIGENNKFQQQLWTNLKSNDISLLDIEMLNYSKNELVRFFEKFNTSSNSDYVSYDQKKSKNLINLNLRPGIKASALTIDNSINNDRDAQFDTNLGFRFGLEAEFIMAFNRNKWAIIVEPTYQYYKAEKQLERYFVEVDYGSIELPVGIRHYIFFKEESKVFFNGSLVYDFPLNRVIDYDTVTDLEIRSGLNFAIGFGCKFNDKYSLEIRYNTSRDVLSQWQTYDSDYKAISVIAGYSIF